MNRCRSNCGGRIIEAGHFDNFLLFGGHFFNSYLLDLRGGSHLWLYCLGRCCFGDDRFYWILSNTDDICQAWRWRGGPLPITVVDRPGLAG
jgi:hypothetical protein